MTTTIRYWGLTTGPQPTNHDVGTCSRELAVPVLPARDSLEKGKPAKLDVAVPPGAFTAPSNPPSIACRSAADITTCPATAGANVFTTLPDGPTIPAATCGLYRVPPLAKVA